MPADFAGVSMRIGMAKPQDQLDAGSIRGDGLQTPNPEDLTPFSGCLSIETSGNGLLLEFGNRIRKKKLDQRLIGDIGFRTDGAKFVQKLGR